ncbi:hypothetical protein Clacol_009380 [Clathrus columnatus]|uniref:Uncharacterized protein n=1 Tax=Clathrus columnatus TaxID=1419009 RepID=A0AAV5AL11_9AGAM|nr:hypothetical protein Clacol_009380 [Clathrus columnatus]
MAEMGERNDLPAMDNNGPRASISRAAGSANFNDDPQDEDQFEEDIEDRLIIGNNMMDYTEALEA